MAGAAGDFGYCLDLLAASDPDRRLAVFYLPAHAREAAAAIHAFDTEVARIAALVSDPVPGEIRLTWWRETIEGSREPGNNPVARALLAAITAHDLPSGVLLDCLEARRFDLYHDPMPDRAALEGWCGETHSALFNLVGLVAGAPRGTALADACGHGGVAFAAARLAAGAGRHRAAGRCYLPADYLAAAGLDVDSWLAEAPDTRHLKAIEALIMLARHHLELARRAIGELATADRAALLILATTEPLLRATERAGLDIFTREPAVGPLARNWRFWRAALSGMP